MGNRLKVLIVDDEYKIGQLISKLIKWDELSLEKMGVLSNSEEALSVIREKHPDVVITDIRMPRISGLDLIRMAREEREITEFVVISGYREFEYAHKAMEYGVEHYLLKPINGEELNDALSRVVIKRADRESVMEMKLTVAQSRKIIRSNLLQSIIDGVEYAESEEVHGVDLTHKNYLGIDIKLDYLDLDNFDVKRDRMECEKAAEAVENILKSASSEVLVTIRKNLHITALINFDDEREKDVRSSFEKILGTIQDILEGFDQYLVTIGVGRQKSGFSECRDSLREAELAVDERLKYGAGRIIYPNMISESEQEMIERIEESHREKISRAVNSFSKKDLEFEIGRAFDELIEAGDSYISLCYRLAEKLIDCVCQAMGITTEDTGGASELLHLINYCGRYIQLRNYVTAQISEMLVQNKEALEAQSAKPIRHAKEYISQHYMDQKLLLEDVAGEIGLNPIYFSTLFKKETGENFSTYLVNIRMSRAKELLLSTNDTMIQICEEVGYRDSRYFSQLFRKVVGVKPAMYRKLHA